jgi:ferrochelatase
MTYFLPEPAFKHDQPMRIGILLINLGTPEAPTAGAVRPYLKEFLSDRRVVEIPRAVWWPILNGVILNTRPRQSAEKYAAIWQTEGSPLKVHTERLSGYLAEELRKRCTEPIAIEYAMRYGQPNVAGAIGRLKAQGCDRLLVVPLYPQYAASSSGTALDAVFRVLLHTRNMPDIRTIRHFHDDPGYINALKQSVERYWAEHGQGDVLLMSFHGVPRYTLDKGDPYHCECRKTGRLLAEALNLKPEQYRVAFQSRFGKGRVVEALHRRHAGDARQGPDQAFGCHLSGVHRRLPGDPGRDRHGRQDNLPERWRRRFSLHPRLEQPARLGHGAGRYRRQTIERMAGRLMECGIGKSCTSGTARTRSGINPIKNTKMPGKPHEY